MIKSSLDDITKTPRNHVYLNVEHLWNLVKVIWLQQAVFSSIGHATMFRQLVDLPKYELPVMAYRWRIWLLILRSRYGKGSNPGMDEQFCAGSKPSDGMTIDHMSFIYIYILYIVVNTK